MNAITEANPKHYPEILSKYMRQSKHFPLIISVLSGKQKGTIYCDQTYQNFFIVHNFGFAQMLELEPNVASKDLFRAFLLSKKKFPFEKIRWYDVNEDWSKRIKHLNCSKIKIVERAQLKHVTFVRPNTPSSYFNNFEIKSIGPDLLDEIKLQLNLNIDSRFWPSKESYLQHAFGSVVLKQGSPIGVCYACAVTNKYAEVDIFTDIQHRGKGVAYSAFKHFATLCEQHNISPHWDCYTNNAASFHLARKIGFSPYYTYKHAIISK